MIKGLKKRSEFILVLTTIVPVMQIIEADEAYITMPNSSAVAVKVQRDREKQLAAFLTANPTITGAVATATWGLLDPTFGRVSLDNPIDTDGNLKNMPVTTAANDLKHGERVRNPNVGFKETITLQSNVAGNGMVLIELVHYVPVDQVAA